MSDRSVAEALRSAAKLVVIEAPAGCGKTHQAASYATWLEDTFPQGRALFLTHTHAACDVLRQRRIDETRRTHVSTFDGFITQIARTYHQSLGLPADVARWASTTTNGFEHLGERVWGLLESSPAVCSAIVSRYPVIVCDEHQDTHAAQHGVLVRLFLSGAVLRVFGDPLQAIYAKHPADRTAHRQRWAALQQLANSVDRLDVPHRWRNGSPALGEWVLAARHNLIAGDPIDLRGEHPDGLQILQATNTGYRGGFNLAQDDARGIRRAQRDLSQLMVLTPNNELANGIHSFFGRRVRIWEGHVRKALHTLAHACGEGSGNAATVARATVAFLESTVTGFNATARHTLLEEVDTGATARRRGVPAEYQAMARCILESPDHCGAARAIQRLLTAVQPGGVLQDLKIDLYREVHEASRLDQFADAVDGQAELARRRSAVRTFMPPQFVSTVHKAKGLESENVLVMPCDAQQFSTSDYKRCVLYVALSRATHRLILVLGRDRPSALFRIS